MRFAPLHVVLSAVALCAVSSAQLIPVGQPIPKRASPPVVFLDGYQSGCTGSSDFASNFSTADKVLQTANLATVYFDNCSVSGGPSIEALGLAFGKFLSTLKYDDGSTVTLVDVVAHSMGGLIVRSYLAGKTTTAATFAPPLTTGIRKAIFLSSPNFGTKVASLFGQDAQTQEMSPASPFLFDLNTWNQGTDDLRGVDALSIAGNAGTGLASGVTAGYDDGVVSITSSSIGFARGGRTKLVPYCHTGNSLVYFLGACPSTAPALNAISDPTTVVSKLILSFLTGTADWQSLGQGIEQNNLGSANGGILLVAHAADDSPLAIDSATVATSNASLTLGKNGNNAAFTEEVLANTSLALQVNAVGGATVALSQSVAAGTSTPITMKAGPRILRVIPAAASVFPYSLAPGEFVGIYGSALATATGTSGQPYPTQLGDVQVTVNGAAVPLQFAGTGQVNVIFPNLDPGLYKMTLKNTPGQQTVNVFVEAAVPAIFTQDASGTGAAAALNAISGVLVTASVPLHAGDYVSLYLTGLGRTNSISGFDYAVLQPTVTVGGQQCAVSYAGRNPFFAGLDQINCQIPAGLAAGAQPVVVTSGTRSSNQVTLAIQ